MGEIKKKVTLKDVAALSGVSLATVSLILNNSQASFSDSTRKRVYEAARQLNYQIVHKHSASKPHLRGSKLLVVSPSVINPYYVNLYDAIARHASKLGYNVFLFNTDRVIETEMRLTSIAESLGVSGVVCMGSPSCPTAFFNLAGRLPTIQIDDKKNEQYVGQIELNNEASGEMLAEYLLGIGHRRIAFLAQDIPNVPAARSRRLEGICRRFEQWGLKREDVVCFTLSSASYNKEHLNEYEIGYRLATDVLNDPGITAVVGANDIIAIGAMDAIIDHKLRIPQDYSVCGFDNTLESSFRGVSLTTVDHFVYSKAIEAVDMLVRRIESNTDQNDGILPVSTHHIEYEARLVIRNSTGPRRSR